MAHSSILGLFEAMNSKNLTVHQTRCAVVRNKNATCMKCAQACTSGCISYFDNELIISPELCIGCGTCATVCPTCALESRNPTDGELYAACKAAAAASGGHLVVSCEQFAEAALGLYDETKVVQVVCLGRVEESLIVRLVADGAVSRVTLVEGPCEGCEHAVGLSTAQAVCETANILLETWGSGVRVRLARKLPGFVRRATDAAFDVGRRAFFASMKDEAKTVAATSVDLAVRDALGSPAGTEENLEHARYLKVMADGTLPHFIPDRRERLLDALAAMGEPADVLISTRLWGHVVIDASACSSCRMCATFCPTGAIVKFDDEDGTIGLEHRAGDCVKCRCCTDICPEGALVLEDSVQVRAISESSVERHILAPRKKVPGGPHSMLNYMKDQFVSTDQVYER